MGYYARAFCTGGNIPSLSTVFSWLERRGRVFGIDQTVVEVDVDSSGWQKAALVYKPGKLPILVECTRDDGSTGCLMRAEVEEFLEFVGDPGSSAKRSVVNRLKETRFIVACQLPTSDIDDGYDANGDFLNFFVENCGGMIQADGEGFYTGSDLIVRLGVCPSNSSKWL